MYMYMYAPIHNKRAVSLRIFKCGSQWLSDCLLLSSSLPHNLIHDTADTPHVHAVVVDAVCEETLWCPVPPRGDVLGTRMLGVDTLAWAKVGQLQNVLLKGGYDITCIWRGEECAIYMYSNYIFLKTWYIHVKWLISDALMHHHIHTLMRMFSGLTSLWNIPFLCMW